MDNDKVVYSLNIEDILTVADELDIDLTESDIDIIVSQIEKSIDWHSIIEDAILGYKDLRELN